jgi:2-polyprenyl-6-methoxyphenol hydroxylase-like FAD-dependent oxidoreductase
MSNSPSGIRRSVLIVGGGIGGLAAAVSLRRAGHTVEVIELKRNWAVTGWGLSLTGPALRALAALELHDTCIEAGYGITAITNCAVDGTVLNTIELPSLLGAGKPAQIGLGRPKLSSVLREAAVEHGAELRTGLTVAAIEDDGTGVHATLSDGSTRTVDLIVGADGVGSKTRALMGIDNHPSFTGQCVWRASVDRPSWAECLYTFTAPNHSSGLIPISDTEAYVFCTEGSNQPEPMDNAERLRGMRRLLAPLGGQMEPVVEAIVNPDRIVRRPVLNLFVDQPWHCGKTVLIGDAAHTGGPQMVSGAALAIEDAVVLAQELDANSDLDKALKSFCDRRRERARLVVDTTLQITKLELEFKYADVHALQRNCHAVMAQEI